MSDILVEAQRLAHVAVDDAAPIVDVLLAQGRIEPVSVTGGGNVDRSGALAEHLLNGIARDQVNQKKYHRHDQPDDRQQEAAIG